MDKIWDRNPSKSEVIGRCGGDEKNEWSRWTDKSRTLKKIFFIMSGPSHHDDLLVLVLVLCLELNEEYGIRN